MLFVVPDFGKIEIGAACGIAPTLRTGREEWGTHFVGRVRETESMGHPPPQSRDVRFYKDSTANVSNNSNAYYVITTTR